MNNKEQNFTYSQDYELLRQKKGKAYSIKVKDWDYIKSQLDKIKIETNYFNPLGWLLLGGTISCLITIISTDLPTERKNIMWVIIISTFVCGGLSLYFAHKTHYSENIKPKDLKDYMDRIDEDFKD